MSNYSRAKKNQDLYQQLNTDRESDITTEGLSQYANRLNTIDQQFEEMQVSATSQQAAHARRNAYFNPIEEKITPNFRNEYLDEFIDEVKQYNIKKGLRSVEDTQTNILNELRGVTVKDIHVPLKTEEDKTEVSEPQAKEDKPAEQFKESLASQIQKLLEETNEEEKTDEQAVVINNALNEEILAQTTEIKKQIDDYSDELDKVNSKVNSTNKMLNVILVLLFIALLVVLGGLFYFLVIKRGLLS